MKDKRSLHLKVQELCDCYATTDPLKEMSELEKDRNGDEPALKWLALAILHGVNANAKNISISRSNDGKVRVTGEYRKADLPNPEFEIGEEVIKTVKAMSHLEGKKGQTDLSIGIRGGSVEMKVEVKKEDGMESVNLQFPK
jgi:hypothetical protein